MRLLSHALDYLCDEDFIRPEKDLMLAVLLNAVNDLVQEGGKRRYALEFFLSENDDWPFCFKSICSELGINKSKFVKYLGITEDGKKLNLNLIKKFPKSLAVLKASSAA